MIMDKQIAIGVDQITLVLKTTDISFEFDEWRGKIAPNIIDEFLDKSKMNDIFKNFGDSDVKIPEGYNIGYSFVNSPFYFCIAYHESFYNMGIIVKFSAHSWDEYRKRFEQLYNEPLHIHTFFQLIESKLYSFRLSRIDPCVDFFNYGIDIAQLKRSIETGRTEIRFGKY